MRQIYLKKGDKNKDWLEVEVYTIDSQGKGDLSFNCATVRFSTDKGTLAIEERGTKEQGFLCSKCKDQVFRERASGHIEVLRGKGLCGMCASTEQTFNRFIGNDDKGEYSWIPDSKEGELKQ